MSRFISALQVVAPCLMCALAGCHGTVTRPPDDTLKLTQLYLHQQRWEARHVEKYWFYYRASGSMIADRGPDVTYPYYIGAEIIEVHNGLITSITDSASGATVTDTSAVAIDGAFDRAADALRRNVFEYQLTFDLAYGYPSCYGTWQPVLYCEWGLQPL